MRFEKTTTRLLHAFHLIARPLTIGVRAAIFDEENRVLLVRHTYVSGWYLPGGGVEPGETALDALKRECREEANVELLDPPELFGVYLNRAASNRDHVVLYRCGGFRRSGSKEPDREIAETGFFAIDALPQEATAATRRRLRELHGHATPDQLW